MAIPEKIKRLAHQVRTAIYGKEVRESIAQSMEETANVADEAKQVTQQLIDGSFDEGALNSEIEQRLNDLETEYTPRLSAAEQKIDGNHNEVTAQLAQIVDELDQTTEKVDINIKRGFKPIQYEQNRDEQSRTDYYITRVRHLDDDGNIIKLKRGFGKDEAFGGEPETARSFANRKGASLVINASTFDPVTSLLRGTHIYNGTVFQSPNASGRYLLGIKDDNTLMYFDPGTPAETMIEQGAINALIGFAPIVLDGEAYIIPNINDVIPGYDEGNPRQVIAQKQNKDIVILTCDGRTLNNQGMTVYDLQRILVDEGVEFAYMLDGGNSAQTSVRGRLINKPSEKNEREIPDFIYFGDIQKELDKDLSDLGRDIGVVGHEINNIYLELADRNGFSSNVDIVMDANSITKSGFYWIISSSANIPQTSPLSAWGLFHFSFGASGGMAQFAFPFSISTALNPMRRRYDAVQGTWSDWV